MNKKYKIYKIKSLQDNKNYADFKMTSQANHLSKLLNLQTENERLDRHYQRLYKRRRTESSKIRSNWDIFGTISKKYYDV